MDNGVKVLEKVYQTTDGRIFGTLEEANKHQDIQMKRNAFKRLTDNARKRCTSVSIEMLEEHGFFYNPLLDKDKDKNIYDSSKWTGY